MATCFLETTSSWQSPDQNPEKTPMLTKFRCNLVDTVSCPQSVPDPEGHIVQSYTSAASRFPTDGSMYCITAHEYTPHNLTLILLSDS
eukprot:15188494-Ditylum_brightwellii.AAC.1